jgi:predicted anti-sigma-YlaC factor YlaD
VLANFQEFDHVNEDSIGLNVLGDLPILQRVQVEEHLAKCRVCRDRSTEVQDLIAVFRMATRTTPISRTSLAL